jgi:hypothetical protein
LHDYGDIQGSAAAGATLSFHYARHFAAQIQVGRHGVRANRAEDSPFGVVFNKGSHWCPLTHFYRRWRYGCGCTEIVKIYKSVAAQEVWLRMAGRYRRSADDTLNSMTQPTAPKIQMVNTAEYRENYANSVQVRVNLWDFFLMFGRVNQTAPDSVSISNFQGVYVSPQQAKALLNVLQQNVTQYEAAFGEIRLEASAGGGIVQ